MILIGGIGFPLVISDPWHYSFYSSACLCKKIFFYLKEKATAINIPVLLNCIGLGGKQHNIIESDLTLF